MALRNFAGVFAALMVFATACGTDSTTSDKHSTAPEVVKKFDPALAAKLDAAIATTIKDANVPGVVVSISGPDGEYLHTAGVADKATKAPYETDFYGRIGSVTKTFTVTGILQLVGDGKLGLDDPISKYIDGVPEGDKVTLRMLAGMRSGLPDYSTNETWQQDFFSDTSRSFTPQQLLDYAFTQPMVFAPGTEFKYTNANLILLGLVLEKVSKQPIQDYIKEHILSPLKMTHTSFPTSPAFPDPHAQGYTTQTLSGDEEISTNWNPSWAWAAGEMISNVDDLKIWAKALAEGTLLKPEVQKQRLEFKSARNLPPPDGYGLAIFNLGDWIGHNGSLPGYETVCMYLPEKQLTMVIMLNTDENFQGEEPSTLIAQAVTKIVSPENIYYLAPTVQ